MLKMPPFAFPRFVGRPNEKKPSIDSRLETKHVHHVESEKAKSLFIAQLKLQMRRPSFFPTVLQNFTIFIKMTLSNQSYKRPFDVTSRFMTHHPIDLRILDGRSWKNEKSDQRKSFMNTFKTLL